jgi:hypothetical protein
LIPFGRKATIFDASSILLVPRPAVLFDSLARPLLRGRMQNSLRNGNWLPYR